LLDELRLLDEPIIDWKHRVNIYITSDEEIRDNDYYLYDYEVLKCDKTGTKDVTMAEICKKIILTTDPTLIADGVQVIDDDFLEWYVKNSSCEFVSIITTIVSNSPTYKTNMGFERWRKDPEKIYDMALAIHNIGKTCTTKQEEPKKESYICPHTKIQCDDECCVSTEECHITSSLASGIVDCAEPNQGKKPHLFCETPEENCTFNYCDENGCQNRKRELVESYEQETLEEATDNVYNEFPLRSESLNELAKENFIKGANWQAQRMYSEEEVERLCMSAYNQATKDGSKAWLGTFEEWFEKVKKK
jgi:hypothetical protein